MSAVFWFRLTLAWCSGRTGLTLPFIAGADAISRGFPPVSGNAGRIVSEICSRNIPNHLVWIRVCPDLGVPVIGVHRFPKSGVQIDLGDKFGASDEEKLRSLAEDAQAMINAGKFSRVGDYPNQQWAPFQPQEIEFINSIIQKT
jgi:hypothetical protein